MRGDSSVVSDLSCIVVACVFVVAFLAIAVRLKSVQIDGAANFSYENVKQSLRRVQTAGPRGRILDCRGRILAGNRSSVSIACRPERFQKRTWRATTGAILTAVTNVSEIIGMKVTLSETAVRRHISQTLPLPLIVWRDVSAQTLARFCEHERDCPGFVLVGGEERTYPFGRSAAHVIGYVGKEISTVESGDSRFNYAESEPCGRTGVERYYDGYLRGVPGERDVQVDARGFAITVREILPARPGPDLALTLDAEVQCAAHEVLQGLRAACVVLDPRDGSVIALASSPAYDPNSFVPSLSPALYSELLADKAKPLLNRASGGLYAPGSTFKPITALAGLKHGWPPGREHDCCGFYECGGMTIRCAMRWGHRSLDLPSALRESCNPFFCNLGCRTGTNDLCAAARAMGLGSRTGADISEDRAGVVPDAVWKMRHYNQRWYPGDVAQMSIGQGMVLVTPLQMAVVAGAIGTGHLVRPHLRSGSPVVERPLPFSPGHVNLVREGMRRVVNGGTGWRGGVDVAANVIGKTGTAEVGPRGNRRKNTWFIAYAEGNETSRPEAQGLCVSVAVLVENGTSGGGTAAPLAARVLQKIFGVYKKGRDR